MQGVARRAALLVVLSWGLADQSQAQPQPPSAGEVAAARDLFREGARAAREGRWAEALDAFDRSFALYPSPLTLVNLAGAQAQTGRLVEAAESYRRFLRSAGPAEASLRADVEVALAEVVPRLGHLRARAVGLQAGDVLLLDGDPLSRAALGTAIPVNPGVHVLTIRRNGGEVGRAELTAAEGATAEITIEVRPEPDAAPARAEPRAVTAASPEPRTRTPAVLAPSAGAPRADGGGILSRWWFWTGAAIVVAAGAIVAWIIFSTDAGAPFEGNASPGVLEVE